MNHSVKGIKRWWPFCPSEEYNGCMVFFHEIAGHGSTHGAATAGYQVGLTFFKTSMIMAVYLELVNHLDPRLIGPESANLAACNFGDLSKQPVGETRLLCVRNGYIDGAGGNRW